MGRMLYRSGVTDAEVAAALTGSSAQCRPPRRGLRHIDASLQHVAVGDGHSDWGPGDPVLRVAELDPAGAVVYFSLRDKAAGHRLHLRLKLRANSSLLVALGGVFDWATVVLLFAGLRERLQA